jgi:hypothetical protein
MVRKIILEEAFVSLFLLSDRISHITYGRIQNLPGWIEMSKYQAALFTPDGDGDAHARRLVDINDMRLQKMSKSGFHLLSVEVL